MIRGPNVQRVTSETAFPKEYALLWGAPRCLVQLGVNTTTEIWLLYLW